MLRLFQGEILGVIESVTLENVKTSEEVVGSVLGIRH